MTKKACLSKYVLLDCPLLCWCCLSRRPSTTTILYFGLRFLKCNISDAIDNIDDWQLWPTPTSGLEEWEAFQRSVDEDLSRLNSLGPDKHQFMRGSFVSKESGDIRFFIHCHTSTISFSRLEQKKVLLKKLAVRNLPHQDVKPESDEEKNAKLMPYYHLSVSSPTWLGSDLARKHRRATCLKENSWTEILAFCLKKLYASSCYQFFQCFDDDWCQVGDFNIDSAVWFPFSGTPNLLVMSQEEPIGCTDMGEAKVVSEDIEEAEDVEVGTIECKMSGGAKGDFGVQQICGALLKLAGLKALLKVLQQKPEEPEETVQVDGLLLHRKDSCWLYNLEVKLWSNELPKIYCTMFREGGTSSGYLLSTLKQLWEYK